MPYEIRRFKDGFKVCKRDNPTECFSKKGIPKARAIKQLRAIGMNEHKGGAKKTLEEIEAHNKRLEEERKKREANKGAIRCPPDRLYDPNKQYRGDENVCLNNPDGTITYVDLGKQNYEPCFVGKNFVGFDDPERCKEKNKVAFAEWEKEKHPENYYFFRPALKAITAVGDKLVDAVPMPEIVKDVYKGAREMTRDSIEGYGKPRTGKPLDAVLYNRIKDEVYKRNPKHSLYRSALIQKIYQSEGGKYEEGGLPKMNIKKWFKQDWISLNDYLRGDIVPCGANKAEEYGEYPLCRPKAIADKLSSSEIRKMIKEKTKIGEKPLKTSEVIGREDLNIKPTNTGLGMDKFLKQLKEIGLDPETYLEVARRVAKREGYNPDKLELALNNDNKLKYDSPDGVKYFGKASYNDFIIWCYLERNNEVPAGYADMKRNVFRKSHGAMGKKYNLGKYAPNTLALRIIW